jgi:Flp pilus assembly protein TadB/Mg-chelatase subunit ChlD
MTSRVLRALLALALAPTLGLMVVEQAAVATPPQLPTARISQLQPGAQLHFVISVTGLVAGADVDAKTVRVTADGRALRAHGVSQNSPGGATDKQAPRREAMLVVDTSGSMQGGRLEAAKAAALSYAQVLPADVRLGLVSFSARPALRLRPTTDRTALRRAVSSLTASGSTALYDGVWSGLTAFGREDRSRQRRMLILSDGADTASRRPLVATTARLRSSGVGTDAVGISLTGRERGILRRLAAAGSGRVLTASGLGQLDSAFVRAAQTFSQQVSVTADLPAALAGRQVRISATVVAGGRVVAAAGTARFPAAHAAPVVAEDPTPTALPPTTDRLPIILLLFTFLGLLAIGLMLAIPQRRPVAKARLDEVDAYQWSVPMSAAASVDAADGHVATVALSVVDKLLRSGPSRTRIRSELERAGLRIRPQEWILLRISAAIAAIAGITVLTGSLLAGVLVGTLFGWLATMLLLKVKASRRCAAFADQLPDVLQLIASSLRSGFTLAQALEAVVREGDQPASEELTRALTEARLGLPLEQALDQVAARMQSQDLEWVVMAMRISRDVGGNLAEVLLTTVHTMRERGQLRRQVRALSAEGRLSGYILVALPVAVAAWFMLVRPEYLRPLFTTPVGIMMLIVALLGVAVGSWWMSRIVKVEI